MRYLFPRARAAPTASDAARPTCAPVVHPGKPCSCCRRRSGPAGLLPAAGAAALDHRPAAPLARWPARCRSRRSAGPAPAAVVDPAPLACCLLALAAALACHDCRAAGLASFTPRSTPHITPPQHHAGGPPAPGSNTYGVAFIVTRCTITLHAHPR